METKSAGAVSHPKWELTRWYMKKVERTAERGEEAAAKTAKTAPASVSKAIAAGVRG